MKDDFHTQCTVILDCKNGKLENYPATSHYKFSFDATDMTIYGYVEQFRTVLRAAGFSEKCIADSLGEF
jgi:hypothetical protein